MARKGSAARWIGRAFHVGALCALAVAVTGCGSQAPAAREADAVTPPSTADPTAVGGIRGRVRWSGPLPHVPPIEGWLQPEVENGPRRHQSQPDPNAPVVAANSDGLANAVIFMRGVGPLIGRPWDLPPVRVEMRDRQLHILQGETDSTYGFTHCGNCVEIVSRDRIFHALHADGVAFFSLTFPEPNSPLSRRFDRPGVIELTSAAGYPWMRAYLFVSSHPFLARTAPEGGFTLDRVPEGDYELVCWVPSWVESRHDRDPENGLIIRRYVRPAVEKTARVHVARGQATEVLFVLSLSDFRP